MLKIQFKDRSGPVVKLEAPGKTIGKGTVNDLVINNDTVNSFHADLTVEGDTVVINDVNTASGTFVNGDRISGPVVLKAGDTIGIGGVDIEVVDESQSDPMEGKTLVLSGKALMDMGAGGWSLIADSGPEKGQVIPLMEKISIGRALECDISILEPGLSRRHAELDIVDGELILTDLGSSNGTFVNAKKADRLSLRQGDVLQFDKVKFIVHEP